MKFKIGKMKNIIMFIILFIEFVTSSFEDSKKEVDIVSAFNALLIDQFNQNTTLDNTDFRANCELECPPGCKYSIYFNDKMNTF
jgi:hypothetical protein